MDAMLLKILSLCALGAVSEASLHYFGHHGQGQAVSSQKVVREHIADPLHQFDDHHSHHEEHSYPKYKFEYSVNDPHTKDQKQQWESRDGDRVEGQYSFLQPDGSTRTVSYTADKHNGFQAHIETTGGEHNHIHELQNFQDFGDHAGYFHG